MFQAADHAVIQKVLRRLIPFCVLCYLLNYVDRVNISIARFRMHDSIDGFSDQVYNIGAGVFFLAYFLFELPSNLIQERVGPRRWIARIMISWGIISICFMFTQGPRSFYLLRFLLGMAEAGFFPGIILYLSYWVPHDYRARASAAFLTSTAISGVVGNILGGYILYFADQHHLWLQSWQWLFVIEGVPTIVLGAITLFFLTDKPADAKWLSPEERTRLAELMARERREHPAGHTDQLVHAFASFHTWILSLLYGLVIWGFYTVNFYTTAIIKKALTDGGMIGDKTPAQEVSLYVGLISAIPFAAAAVGMVLIGRHSDRHNERKFHLAFACGLIAVGMTMAAIAQGLSFGTATTILTIVGLSIGAIGAFGMFGPFWSLPPQLLTGTAAAAAFAVINSIGNLSGFFAPLCFNTYSIQVCLYVAAACGLAAVVLTLLAPIPRPSPRGFPVIDAEAPSAASAIESSAEIK